MSVRSFLSHTRSNWRKETQLLLLGRHLCFLRGGSPSGAWRTRRLGARALAQPLGAEALPPPPPKTRASRSAWRTQARGGTGVRGAQPASSSWGTSPELGPAGRPCSPAIPEGASAWRGLLRGTLGSESQQLLPWPPGQGRAGRKEPAGERSFPWQRRTGAAAGRAAAAAQKPLEKLAEKRTQCSRDAEEPLQLPKAGLSRPASA